MLHGPWSMLHGPCYMDSMVFVDLIFNHFLSHWSILKTFLSYQGLDAKAYSTTLQYVEIPILPNCYNSYLRQGLQIKPETQVCAGKRKQDSCNADSGGPLIAK